MTRKLDKKIALITGATSGIGLATAQRFALEGAQVIVTGRRQATLDKAVEAIGHDAVGLRVDSSDPAALDHLYDVIDERFGRIDVLYANAGGGSMLPLGRVGEPDEIAKAAVLLASDDASFVNGAELFVDGGMAQV